MSTTPINYSAIEEFSNTESFEFDMSGAADVIYLLINSSATSTAAKYNITFAAGDSPAGRKVEISGLTRGANYIIPLESGAVKNKNGKCVFTLSCSTHLISELSLKAVAVKTRLAASN